jgi:hypothetical protein
VFYGATHDYLNTIKNSVMGTSLLFYKLLTIHKPEAKNGARARGQTYRGARYLSGQSVSFI